MLNSSIKGTPGGKVGTRASGQAGARQQHPQRTPTLTSAASLRIASSSASFFFRSASSACFLASSACRGGGSKKAGKQAGK